MNRDQWMQKLGGRDAFVGLPMSMATDQSVAPGKLEPKMEKPSDEIMRNNESHTHDETRECRELALLGNK